jgi:hypothetical protein
LQQENRALRRELVDIQNKLSSLSATIQMLTDSVSQTLDGVPLVKCALEEDERPTGTADLVGQTARSHVSGSSPEDLLTLVPDLCEPVLLDEFFRTPYPTTLVEENYESFPTFTNRATANPQHGWTAPEALEGTMGPEAGLTDANSFSYVQIPNIWAYAPASEGDDGEAVLRMSGCHDATFGRASHILLVGDVMKVMRWDVDWPRRNHGVRVQNYDKSCGLPL